MNFGFQPNSPPNKDYANTPGTESYEKWSHAGFWLRFFAYLIDSYILTLIVVLLTALTASSLGLSLADSPINFSAIEPNLHSVGKLGVEILAPASAIPFLLYVLVLCYGTLLEASSIQATVGKKLLGLVVTDVKHQKATTAQVLKRNLLKQVPGLSLTAGILIVVAGISFSLPKRLMVIMFLTALIVSAIFLTGYLLAGLSLTKQALHDKWCDTLVLKRPMVNPFRRPAVICITLFILLLAGAVKNKPELSMWEGIENSSRQAKGFSSTIRSFWKKLFKTTKEGSHGKTSYSYDTTTEKPSVSRKEEFSGSLLINKKLTVLSSVVALLGKDERKVIINFYKKPLTLKEKRKLTINRNDFIKDPKAVLKIAFLFSLRAGTCDQSGMRRYTVKVHNSIVKAKTDKAYLTINRDSLETAVDTIKIHCIKASGEWVKAAMSGKIPVLIRGTRYEVAWSTEFTTVLF